MDVVTGGSKFLVNSNKHILLLKNGPIDFAQSLAIWHICMKNLILIIAILIVVVTLHFWAHKVPVKEHS
jgi:hypothetical protein